MSRLLESRPQDASCGSSVGEPAVPLHQLVASSKRGKIHGGVGKSALALATSQRFRSQHCPSAFFASGACSLHRAAPLKQRPRVEGERMPMPPLGGRGLRRRLAPALCLLAAARGAAAQSPPAAVAANNWASPALGATATANSAGYWCAGQIHLRRDSTTAAPNPRACRAGRGTPLSRVSRWMTTRSRTGAAQAARCVGQPFYPFGPA